MRFLLRVACLPLSLSLSLGACDGRRQNDPAPRVDAGVDVVDDPSAGLALVDVLGIEAAAQFSSPSVSVTPAGTTLLAIRASVADDARATSAQGELPFALPAGPEQVTLVAAFSEDAVPLWTLAVDGGATFFRDGIAGVSGVWDAGGDAVAVDGASLARIDDAGRLQWAAPRTGGIVFDAALSGPFVLVSGSASGPAAIGGLDVPLGERTGGTIFVAALDAETGAAAWLHSFSVHGNASPKLGLAGTDDTGTGYLVGATNDAVFDVVTGEEVLRASPASDLPRGFVIAVDEDGARWSFIGGRDDAPSELRDVAPLGDGAVIAVGAARMRGVPTTFASADVDAVDDSALWMATLDKDTGAVAREQVLDGPDFGVRVVATASGLFVADPLLPHAGLAYADGVFLQRAADRVDFALVGLDALGAPRSALAVGGEGVAPFDVVGGADRVALTLQTGTTAVVARAGAHEVVGGPGAHALLLRPVATGAPLPLFPARAVTSPLLRSVGGLGFDAGNLVRLTDDGGVALAARVTGPQVITQAVDAIEVPAGGTYGVIVRFDDQGATVARHVVGSPTAVGTGFPVTSLASTDDGLIVGGATDADGTFDDERTGGAFLARLVNGAVIWIHPLGATLSPCAGADDDAIAAVSTTATSAGFSVDFSSALSLHQPGNGAQTWSVPLPATHACGVILTTDAVVVTAGDGLRAFARSDGAPLWHATRRAGVDVVADGSDVVACERAGNGSVLTRVALVDGAVRTEQVREALCTGLAADDGVIYVAERTRGTIDDATVAALDASFAELRRWSYGGRGIERALDVDVRGGRGVLTGDFRGRTVLDDGTEVRPTRGDALVISFAP